MEDNPRNFNPMSVPGLSDEARQAVNAAFDAMSAWRIETVKNSKITRKTARKSLRRWLRLPGHWGGRSKSWMPRARNFRASRKCRSK